MSDLTDRIEKAEHDRMHKYYREVSQLNDKVIALKPKIDENAKTCEAVVNYFTCEHQVFTRNQINEVLTKCLQGREFNSMID